MTLWSPKTLLFVLIQSITGAPVGVSRMHIVGVVFM